MGTWLATLCEIVLHCKTDYTVLNRLHRAKQTTWCLFQLVFCCCIPSRNSNMTWGANATNTTSLTLCREVWLMRLIMCYMSGSRWTACAMCTLQFMMSQHGVVLVFTLKSWASSLSASAAYRVKFPSLIRNASGQWFIVMLDVTYAREKFPGPGLPCFLYCKWGEMTERKLGT